MSASHTREPPVWEAFGAHRHLVLERKLLLLDLLQDDEQVHELEDAGRIAFGVGLVLEQDLAGRGVHDNGPQPGITGNGLAAG